MESFEKQQNQTPYSFNRHDLATMGRYDDYLEDTGSSVEEKNLVRKIDFFVMPIICVVNLLQVNLK
jgi:hypothetical protein